MKNSMLRVIGSVLFFAGTTGEFRGQDRSLVPCLAATPDWEPIAVNAPVPSSGREMMAVFRLTPDAKIRTLSSRWVVVDVGDVAPAGHVVAKGDLKVGKALAGRLYYTQDNPIPPGTYRLEVMADGKPWREAEMTVVDTPPPPVASPAALFPLEAGRTWTYALEQEFGQDVKVDPTEAKLDPDGRFRATVTLTLAKEEEQGWHVTLRRDGDVISEEWWRLDEKGLQANARRVGGEDFLIDPPQVMLPVPTESTMKWNYAAPDGSYVQNNRLWSVSSGSAADAKVTYIVVTELVQPPAKIVLERRFVPGEGLVKTVATNMVNGRFVSRETMTLKK